MVKLDELELRVAQFLLLQGLLRELLLALLVHVPIHEGLLDFVHLGEH